MTGAHERYQTVDHEHLCTEGPHDGEPAWVMVVECADGDGRLCREGCTMSNGLADRVVALMTEENIMVEAMAATAADKLQALAATPDEQFEAEAVRLGIESERATEMARLPSDGRAVVLTAIAQMYREKAATAQSIYGEQHDPTTDYSVATNT